MPEGDTIFRTARSLGRAFGGKPITVFRSTYPLLTRFNDTTPLVGQTVTRVESRGKWLLMHFSDGAVLLTHMLMSGSWHIYRHGQRWQKPPSQMRIVMENSSYVAVGFKIPIAEMHTPQSLARDPRIPRANTDLLSPAFDANEVERRLLAEAQTGRAIADGLLDQHVLAGIGNEFKSEICFVAGIHPYAPVSALTPAQIQALIATAQKLLAANVLEDSGDRIVTYRGAGRRTTRFSDPEASHWVYGRAGQPCRRCGTPIRTRLQGTDARVTFWCPLCQPMPDGSDVDG